MPQLIVPAGGGETIGAQPLGGGGGVIPGVSRAAARAAVRMHELSPSSDGHGTPAAWKPHPAINGGEVTRTYETERERATPRPERSNRTSRSNGPRRRVMAPSWRFMALHGASWRLHGASWRLHGASWRFMAPSWRFMALHGAFMAPSWRVMALHGATRVGLSGVRSFLSRSGVQICTEPK